MRAGARQKARVQECKSEQLLNPQQPMEITSHLPKSEQHSGKAHENGDRALPCGEEDVEEVQNGLEDVEDRLC